MQFLLISVLYTMQKTSNGIIIGNTRVFPTNSTKKKRPRKQRGYHIACVCATVAYAVLITLIICTATILIYKFTRDKLSISNGSTTQSAQTISSSTAFTTKISTIVPTTPIVCENLGAYDANLQQCICFAGFSGSKCEIREYLTPLLRLKKTLSRTKFYKA